MSLDPDPGQEAAENGFRDCPETDDRQSSA